MRRSLPQLIALACGVAVATAGCREPPQVRVSFTADPEVVEGAATLRIEVYGTDANTLAASDQVPLAAGDLVDRALGVTLAPEGNDASRGWRIVASVLEGDTELVLAQQEAAGRYAEGARRVNLHFDAECLGVVACDRGLACERGRCEPACVSAVEPEGDERSGRAPCECAFAADGAQCSADGAPGRCWSGECCTGCFDGAACVAGDDEAACGALGVQCAACCDGSACVEGGTCSGAGNSINSYAHHTCVTLDGAVACWGDNAAGQLGDGTREPRVGPVVHEGFAGVTYTGDRHTCFVSYDQELSCWGANGAGQLGFWDGDQLAPPAVVRPYIFRSAALGEDHTCARAFVDGTRSDTSVFCWGADGNRQSGPGGVDAPMPELDDGRDYQQISVFRDTSCALTGEQMLCRGRNSDGQVGVPVMSNGEDDVSPATRGHADFAWQQIEVGHFGTCGITTDDELYCWGLIREFLLGEDGDTLRDAGTLHEPRRVAEGSWTAVRLAINHGCAIDADRRLWCFGSNFDGRLGVDPARYPNATRPVRAGPPGWRWVAVDVGFEHTCAQRENGGIYCWGSNARHQLARENADPDEPLRSFHPLPICGL